MKKKMSLLKWLLRPRPSPEAIEFDRVCAYVREITERLEAGDSSITDDDARDAFTALASRIQSNCDSVAQGLLTTIAGICAHRPHLASELLPDALQSLYYLGIEDLEGIKKYIRSLITYEEPYLGRTTPSGYRYLERLLSADTFLIEAFRVMYSQEDNTWRKDPIKRKEAGDIPEVPPILRSEHTAGTDCAERGAVQP